MTELADDSDFILGGYVPGVLLVKWFICGLFSIYDR